MAQNEENASEKGVVAGQSSQSKLALFLKASVFDFLLVLVLSTALTFTVSYGFYGAEGLRDNFLLEAAVALPLLVALFAGGWSKRALLPSVVATIVVAVAIVGVSAVVMPSGTSFMDGVQINDVAENYMIWAITEVVCVVVTYLLSRRVTLVAVLAVLSVVACGMVQFLYRDWMTWHHGFEAALAVFICVVALFVFQRYRSVALTTQRMGRPAFGRAFAHAAGIGAVCVLLACGVYFAFIAGAGLTTPVIKPFHDYYKRPVVEYSGPIDKQQVENPDITTNNTNNDSKDTNQSAAGGSNTQSTNNGQSSQTEASTTQLLSSYEENNKKEKYESVGYDLVVRSLPIAIPLVLLALLLAVLIRRSRREARIRKMSSRSYAYQVVALYEFLVGRFRKMGIEYPPTLTPMAFAFASIGTMAPYSRNKDNIDFVRVTLVYQRAAYGARDITAQEYQDVLTYYRAFFGNARKQLGLRKWLFFEFWRI